MPWLESPTMASQNSRRETGSTPVVGSSSSRMRGSAISAQASASFCFIPPLSRPASRSVNGSIPNIVRWRRPRSSICGRGTRRRAPT